MLSRLKSATSALAIAALLTSCAKQSEESAREDEPISAYAPTRAVSSDPTDFRPVSADHKGTLTPVTGIADSIAGKTLVIIQPWINLERFELREGPIYFRIDGMADSSEWINTKWNIDSAERICLNGHGTDYCFRAFEDDSGQAFLMRGSDRLLSKVASIEDGDSRNVKELYESNMRAKKAQEEFTGILVGALAKAVLGGGFGGGGGGGGGETYCPDGRTPIGGMCPDGGYSPPEQTYAPGPPPIDPFYGSCHNPMGC